MNFKNTKFKKTKIVATFGPATNTYLEAMERFKEGVNVVRLNTSHGDIKEHGDRLKAAKKAAKDLDLPITFMLDTKGPEIRLGKLTEKFKYKKGDKIKLYYGKRFDATEKGKLWVTYTKIGQAVKKGIEVLFDDGKLSTEVVSITKDYVEVKVKNNHSLSSNKAINIPDAQLVGLPFLSKRDKEMIKWGITQGIDIVAASFVRNKQDLLQLRRFLDTNGGKRVEIQSKIESKEATENINDIIKYSDSIMLARGDLGVEIPYWDVPYYERMLIAKSRAKGKPIVIATQMLDSMMDNPKPTRAEVTDIYYAVSSGADATMLSGESANGEYPQESVETMAAIQIAAEKNFNYLSAYESGQAHSVSGNEPIAYKVAKKSLTSDSSVIMAFSRTGKLVKTLSFFRPDAVIVGLVQDKDIVSKFGCHYGVYAKHQQNQKVFNDDKKIRELAKSMGLYGNIIVANADEYKVVKV